MKSKLRQILGNIISNEVSADLRGGEKVIISQLSDNLEECIAMTEMYQQIWSCGDVPEISGGTGKYFISSVNNPDRIKEFAESIVTYDFDNLNMLWFVGRLKGSIINAGALMFDHNNERLEKGRAATHPDHEGKGAYGKLSKVQKDAWERIGYVVESETNTMHKKTQKVCEEDLGMPSVGFLPLKYEIPSADQWIKKQELKGLSVELIYFDKRVSVVKNILFTGGHLNKRIPETYIIDEIKGLQDIVDSKISTLTIKNGTGSEEYTSEERLDYSTLGLGKKELYTVDDDDTCKWLKLRNSKDLDLESVKAYAKSQDIVRKYIEIEVGTSEEDLKEQRRLIDHGFFPTAYIPVYGKKGDYREDRILMSHLVNPQELINYLEKINGNNLEKLVISSVLPIAKEVISNAKKSLGYSS
jgi:hypothetical protein